MSLFQPAVEVANDGETSLEMLAADPERYDMILMDCFMPGIDGFEATQIIREVCGLGVVVRMWWSSSP